MADYEINVKLNTKQLEQNAASIKRYIDKLESEPVNLNAQLNLDDKQVKKTVNKSVRGVIDKKLINEIQSNRTKNYQDIDRLITNKINKVLSNEPSSLSDEQLNELADAVKYALIESKTRNDKKSPWGKLVNEMTDLMDGYSDYNKDVNNAVKNLISTITSFADVLDGITDIDKLIGKDLFKDFGNGAKNAVQKVSKMNLDKVIKLSKGDRKQSDDQIYEAIKKVVDFALAREGREYNKRNPLTDIEIETVVKAALRAGLDDKTSYNEKAGRKGLYDKVRNYISGFTSGNIMGGMYGDAQFKVLKERLNEVDEIVKGFQGFDIDRITPEAQNTAKQWKQNVDVINYNLKGFNNYLSVISKITKTFGNGDFAEIGFNGDEVTLGDRRSVTMNHTKRGVDFHTHPWEGWNNLSPSAGDLRDYKQMLKTMDKNNSKYLREAYIAQQDRLFKMDFTNIDWSKVSLDKLEDELLNAVADVYAKHGGEVIKDSNGKIKEWKASYDDKQNATIERLAQSAVNKVLSKYGGFAASAKRDEFGNYIDDKTGEIWKASEEINERIYESSAKNLESAESMGQAAAVIARAAEKIDEAADKIAGGNTLNTKNTVEKASEDDEAQYTKHLQEEHNKVLEIFKSYKNELEFNKAYSKKLEMLDELEEKQQKYKSKPRAQKIEDLKEELIYFKKAEQMFWKESEKYERNSLGQLRLKDGYGEAKIRFEKEEEARLRKTADKIDNSANNVVEKFEALDSIVDPKTGERFQHDEIGHNWFLAAKDEIGKIDELIGNIDTSKVEDTLGLLSLSETNGRNPMKFKSPRTYLKSLTTGLVGKNDAFTMPKAGGKELIQYANAEEFFKTNSEYLKFLVVQVNELKKVNPKGEITKETADQIANAAVGIVEKPAEKINEVAQAEEKAVEEVKEAAEEITDEVKKRIITNTKSTEESKLTQAVEENTEAQKENTSEIEQKDKETTTQGYRVINMLETESTKVYSTMEEALEAIKTDFEKHYGVKPDETVWNADKAKTARSTGTIDASAVTTRVKKRNEQLQKEEHPNLLNNFNYSYSIVLAEKNIEEFADAVSDATNDVKEMHYPHVDASGVIQDLKKNKIIPSEIVDPNSRPKEETNEESKEPVAPLSSIEKLTNTLNEVDNAIGQLESAYSKANRDVTQNGYYQQLLKRKAWLETDINLRKELAEQDKQYQKPVPLKKLSTKEVESINGQIKDYSDKKEALEKKLKSDEYKKENELYTEKLKNQEDLTEEERKYYEDLKKQHQNNLDELILYNKNIEDLRKTLTDENEIMESFLGRASSASGMSSVSREVDSMLKNGLSFIDPNVQNDNIHQIYRMVLEHMADFDHWFPLTDKEPENSSVYKDFEMIKDIIEKYFRGAPLSSYEQGFIDVMQTDFNEGMKRIKIEGLQPEYKELSEKMSSEMYKAWKQNTEQEIRVIDYTVAKMRDEYQRLSDIVNAAPNAAQYLKGLSLEEQKAKRQEANIKLGELNETIKSLQKERDTKQDVINKDQRRLAYLKNQLDMWTAPSDLSKGKSSYELWAAYGLRSQRQEDRMADMDNTINELEGEANKNEELISKLRSTLKLQHKFKSTIFQQSFNSETASRILMEQFGINLPQRVLGQKMDKDGKLHDIIGNDLFEVYNAISMEYDKRDAEWNEIINNFKELLPEDYDRPKEYAKRHDALKKYFEGVDTSDEYLQKLFDSSNTIKDLDSLKKEYDYLSAYRYYRGYFLRGKSEFQSAFARNPSNKIALEDIANAQDLYTTLNWRGMGLTDRTRKRAMELDVGEGFEEKLEKLVNEYNSIFQKLTDTIEDPNGQIYAGNISEINKDILHSDLLMKERKEILDAVKPIEDIISQEDIDKGRNRLKELTQDILNMIDAPYKMLKRYSDLYDDLDRNLKDENYIQNFSAKELEEQRDLRRYYSEQIDKYSNMIPRFGGVEEIDPHDSPIYLSYIKSQELRRDRILRETQEEEEALFKQNEVLQEQIKIQEGIIADARTIAEHARGVGINYARLDELSLAIKNELFAFLAEITNGTASLGSIQDLYLTLGDFISHPEQFVAPFQHANINRTISGFTEVQRKNELTRIEQEEAADAAAEKAYNDRIQANVEKAMDIKNRIDAQREELAIRTLLENRLKGFDEQIKANEKRIEEIRHMLYDPIGQKELLSLSIPNPDWNNMTDADRAEWFEKSSFNEHIRRILGANSVMESIIPAQMMKDFELKPLMDELRQLEGSTKKLRELIDFYTSNIAVNLINDIKAEHNYKGGLKEIPIQSETGLRHKSDIPDGSKELSVEQNNRNKLRNLFIRDVKTGVSQYREEINALEDRNKALATAINTLESLKEALVEIGKTNVLYDALVDIRKGQYAKLVRGGFIGDPEFLKVGPKETPETTKGMEAYLGRYGSNKVSEQEEVPVYAEVAAVEIKDDGVIKADNVDIDTEHIDNNPPSPPGGNPPDDNNPPSPPIDNPPIIPEGGIVISSPHVTIVDTTDTEILNANNVTLNANNVEGAANSNKESKGREPISSEVVQDMIAKVTTLLYKSGKDDTIAGSYKRSGLIDLREKLVDFDSSEAKRANLKEWKQINDQYETLTSYAKRDSAKEQAYNRLVDLAIDYINSSVTNDSEGLNNKGLKLYDALTGYDVAEGIPKTPEGEAQRKEIREKIFKEAYEIVTHQMIDAMNSARTELINDLNNGTNYSEQYLNSSDKLLQDSNFLLNGLNGILTGDIAGLDVEEVLKDAQTGIEELKDQAEKSKKKYNISDIVDVNKINKRIGDLETIMYQAVRDSLNTSSEQIVTAIANDLNEHIGNLKAARDAGPMSAIDFGNFNVQGNALVNDIKNIKEINKLWEQTYNTRKDIAELESQDRGNSTYARELKKTLESQKAMIQREAETFGVDQVYVEKLFGTKDEYVDYGKSLANQLQKLQGNIEGAMYRRKEQGFGYVTEFQEEVANEKKIVDELIENLLNIGNAGDNAKDYLDKAVEHVKILDTMFKNTQSTNKYTVKGTQLSDLLGRAREVKTNAKGFGVSGDTKKEISDIVDELEALQKTAGNANDEITGINRAHFDELAVQIDQIKQGLIEAGNYGVDMFTRIGKSLKAQLSAQIARYFSLYDIIRYVRTGVNTIKELDTAMVELRKVTEGTSKEYESFRKEVRATATEIAATNSNLIQSAADWARLGYSIKEATELAKDAQIFVNVGDGVDIKGATDMMITAMKAFNIEADEALSIVDKYNEIGNNFALSATDIGDAMQRSASVLAASNTSFDESIALITAGNEIIQDPEKMGTALRTIALRIRGAKSELEEMGEETDYVVNSTSKLRDLIKGYTSIGGKYEGFDIMEDDNTFKSLADIIKGIGKVYDEMSDIDRTAMLEKLAGKNRSNALAAMLQNYEQIDNVLKSINESEGSALEENAHIVDSIQGRITILQTSAENFWQSFLDTDSVKNTVSALTELLNILTRIIDTTGTMTLVSAGTGFGLLGAKGGYSTIFNGIKDRVNRSHIKDEIKELEELKKLYEISKYSTAIEDVTKKIDAANVSLADANKKIKATSKSFRFAVGSFIATTVISATIAAISYLVNKYREAQKATRDLANESRRSGDSLDDYAKRIAEARETLADENATTDQIRNAKQALIDIQNELNDSYDIYNKKIKDVNTSLEESIELLYEQQTAEMKQYAYRAEHDNEHTFGFGRTTEEKTNTAINGTRVIDLNLSRFHIAQSEVDLLNSLGISTSYTKTALGGAALKFESDDIYTLQTQITQALDLLHSEQYEGNRIATKVEAILSQELTEIKNDLGEYGDSAYNLGGYFLSSNEASADAYEKAMMAALRDSTEGTESTHRAAQEAVNELYAIAKEAGSDCGMYFVKEFFKEYRDGIDQIDFEDGFGKAINVYGRDTTVGAQLGKFAERAQAGANGLTAEDFEEYLRGQASNEQIEKLTDEEKEYLDLISEYIIKYGISIDNAIEYLHNNGHLKTEKEISYEQDYADAQADAEKNFGMTADEFNKLGISNDEQLTMWLRIADASNNAAEATRMMSIYMSEVATSTNATNILKDMEEQYKPTFDAMAEAYKAIWNEQNVFQGMDKVTSEQIQAVSSALESVNTSLKEHGLDMIDSSEIDSFILTLSDADATAEEVQDAFNDIATLLVDSLNPAIAQASGETAELMQKTLKELGVTNAEEVVFTRLGYTAETYAKAKEAADAADIDLDAELSSLSVEQLELVNSTEDLYNYYYGKMLANGTEVTSPEEIQQLLNYCDLLKVTKIGTLDVAAAERTLAAAMEMVNQGIRTGNMELQARGKAQIDMLKKDVNAAAKVGVGYGSITKFNGNNNKSSDKSSDKDTKQKFDWIERAIKKVQRAVSNLGKVADATYKRWDERLGAIIGKNKDFVDEIGQFGRGNIDLYNRPQYMGIDDEYEQDAVTETVRSMAQQDESGRWILVPTIDWDEHGMPREMSNGEAWDHYLDTGEYLGIFETLEEADDYAERLHLQQAAIYTDYDNFVNGKQQKLKEEIALQQQAADAYMQEANAIGLAAEYRDKVMNGMMDIETITDETLKEQISDFQEYYDKATDAADAVEDLRGELASLAQTKFDMITKQFDEMAIEIDHTATRIGHIQSQMEAQGFFESYSLIEQLLFGDEEKLEQKQREAVALAHSIDDAVASGSIEYGSEQWWSMYDALQDVNDQVVELQANIAEFEKQMRQLDWSNFDYMREVISDIVDENNFYIEMLESDNPLFEKASVLGSDIMVENGNWTDSAYAIQGLHVNNIDVLQDQAEEVGREIKDIEAQLAENPYDKDLLDRYRELRKQHQSYIKDIAKEKQAIKDLKKQGYEAFLNYLQKSIDKRKKALEAQKSLFDYQNTIEEQTKSVTDYRKQLAVLGNGSDTEENRARIQTLSENLKKAEKELQQTEYERWLSDQEQMMDDMYESFENLINLRLDDLDALIAEAIKQSKTNSGDISKTIETEAEEYGYDPYNSPFGINIDDRMSNVIGALDRVKLAIDDMWNEAEKYANKQLDALDNLATTFVTHANSEEQTPVTVNVDTSDTSSTSTNPTNTTTDRGDDDRNGRHKEQGTGFDKNDDGVHKTQGPNNANSEQLEKLQQDYNDLERKYDNAMQMKNSYDGRAAKEANLSKRDELSKTAADYAAKAKEYSDAMDKLQKQINALKKSNGKFAKGGTIGKAIKSTGEDGIILARSGEEVLSLERVKQMQSLFKMMQPLAALGTNKTISNIGGSTTVNGMNVSFELPNVTSYEDFVRQAKSDPTFEKMVQNMTIGTALGKSKLSKYSL